MCEVSAFRVEAAVLRAVSESLLTRVATDPTRGAVAIVKERIRLYDYWRVRVIRCHLG